MSDNEDTMAESNSISDAKHREIKRNTLQTLETIDHSTEKQVQPIIKGEAKPFELTAKHHEK